MAATPPPLPRVDNDPIARAFEEARLAPPSAPLFWRLLAFLADTLVVGLIGYLIVTRILLPQFQPEELDAFVAWWDAHMSEMRNLAKEAEIAQEAGDTEKYSALMKTMLTPPENVPPGAISLLSFAGSAMTVIFWIGFSLMEIATGGASLGKKIFRLRVAKFPHGEKPGKFDSIIRSGWKAMCLGSGGIFTTIFAIANLLWPIFNPLKRSLHDLLSRTIVLDARFDPPEKKAPSKEAPRA